MLCICKDLGRCFTWNEVICKTFTNNEVLLPEYTTLQRTEGAYLFTYSICIRRKLKINTSTAVYTSEYQLKVLCAL